jgi:hypothetical protein
MNAQKEFRWIEKFYPDALWNVTAAQGTNSKEESDVNIKMHVTQFVSSVSRGGNSYLEPAEIKTHAQLIKLSCLYEISRVMLTACAVDD